MGDIKFYSPVDFDDTSSGVTIEGELNAKGDVKITGAIYDSNNSPGTSGQVLSSTASGTDWVNQGDVVAGSADKALSVTLTVKNTEAIALTKGQVVCAAPSATPPSGNVIEVKLADNNGTDSMPAIGVLNEGLDAAGGANDEGEAIMFGRVSGIDTSAFDVGDEVFVSDTAGGLTKTKPTGVKYIQKIGVVIRDDASNGTIEVFGAGRTNDVPTPLYVDHTNQRLGIGTTSPGEKLHITDSQGHTQKIQFGLDSIYNYIGVTAYDTLELSVDENNANGNSAIAFRLDGSERIRINTSGNVGIGTTSPATNLMVYDTVSEDPAAPGSATTGMFALNSSGQATLSIGKNSGNTFWISNVNRAFAGPYYYDIALNPLGGNVGIGTTNPTSPLHVVNTVGGWSAYINNDVGTGTQSGLLLDAGSSSSDFAMYVRNAAGSSDLFSIKGNGNVGIGTTNPSARLTVQTAADAQAINIIGRSDGLGYLQFFGSNGTTLNGSIFGGTNGLGFNTNSGQKMTILPSGNVGIGTTSPSEKLDVAGNISLRHTTEDAIKFGGAGDLYGTSSANSVKLQKPGRSQYFLFGTQTGYFQVSDGTNNILLRAESTPEVNIYNTGALNYTQHSATNNNNGNVLTWSNSTSGNGERGRVSIVGDLRLDDYSSGSAVNVVNIENNGDAYFLGNIGIGPNNAEIRTNGDDLELKTDTGNNYVNILTNAGNNLVAKIGIGTWMKYGLYAGMSSIPSAVTQNTHRVIIQGSGTTSSTTALLVENSSGSDLFKIRDDGNVGIGTTSPTERLHVVGDAKIEDDLHVEGDLHLEGDIGFRVINSGGFGQPKIELPNFADVFYRADRRFTVTTTGGTTNVSGLFGGNFSSLTSFAANTTHTITINVSNQSGVPANGFTYPQGYIYISFYSTTNNYDSISGRFKDKDNNYHSMSGLTDIIPSDSSYKVMRLTVPSNNYAVEYEITLVTGASLVRLAAINYLSSRHTSQMELPYLNKTLDTNRLFGNVDILTNSSVAQNRLSGTGNSYLNANTGNVGIGTTNPASKLHLSDTAVILTTTSTNGVSGFIHNVIGGATALYRLQNNGSERMRITSSGNVGIGTTNPSEKLHVVGNAILTTSDSRLRGGDTAGRLVVSNSNTTSYITLNGSTRAGGANEIAFVANSTASMLINSSGNLGIGTTNPSHKLEVSAKGTQLGSSGYYINSSFADTDSNVGVFIAHNDTSNGVGAIAGVNELSFVTYGTSWGERMRIDGSGNVGIGTTSPQQELHVEGFTRTATLEANGLTGSINLGYGANFKGGLFNDQYLTGDPANSINDFVTYTPTKYHITVGTPTNKVITVDSSNNVGVTGNIHVVGATRLDSGGGQQPGVIINQTPTDAIAAVGITSTSVFLSEPDEWLTINIGGTDYVIPAYLP